MTSMRRRRRSACGTTRTSSSTTCCNLPDGDERAAARALDGRADSAVRGRGARARAARRSCPASPAACDWFLQQPARSRATWSRAGTEPGAGERRLLSLLRGHRMKALLRAHARRDRVPVRLRRARAVARAPRRTPTCSSIDGDGSSVRYAPAESDSRLFGGNSNWRGPIWLPVNYLLIESLQKFHHYYGDDFKVECPTGSGTHAHPRGGRRRAVAPAVAAVPARTTTGGGRCWRRPAAAAGRDPRSATTCLFYEYFHGDTGRGVGASHQTGWTALVALLLQPAEIR